MRSQAGAILTVHIFEASWQKQAELGKMQRCQFSGNFLISGNFALHKRIGKYVFPGNFGVFQEILTIVTGISKNALVIDKRAKNCMG